MTPDEARSRFAGARVARLATVGPNSAPSIVPVTFSLDGDRIVTAVDAKPKRDATLRRVENIEANPRVTLLADHYDDDWGALWWVRAEGRGRIVTGGPEMERAFARLRARYPQYGSMELVGPAIVVTVERWTGWQAGGGIRPAGRDAR